MKLWIEKSTAARKNKWGIRQYVDDVDVCVHDQDLTNIDKRFWA